MTAENRNFHNAATRPPNFMRPMIDSFGGGPDQPFQNNQ
jgi:hypothetical protein